MPSIPLLRDILPGPDPRPPISLSLLAKELNVPISCLTPLVEQGYLKAIDSQTVEAPTKEGLLWLRGWFQPAQAKPLFSARDIAGILDVEEGTIPALAAAHDAPVTHDAALGLTFSVWSARNLIMAVLSTGVRFDRQALLWFLVGDPSRACPDFRQTIEDEVQRVGQLKEPMRSIRREALLANWKDAKAVAGVEGPESVEKQFRRL
jgi:hypothetical protein